MHFKAKLVLISTSHTIISIKNRLIKFFIYFNVIKNIFHQRLKYDLIRKFKQV